MMMMMMTVTAVHRGQYKHRKYLVQRANPEVVPLNQ